MERILIILIICISVLAFSGCSDNGKLSEETGIPVSEVPDLAATISQSQGQISSVEFRGMTLDMNQCLYILARGIAMINRGESGSVPVKKFSDATNPSGTVTSARIARKEYVDMAERTYRWMDENGRVPNHVGVFEGGADDLSPEMMLRLYVKVLTEYKKNNRLPESVNIP